jgi:hypothetical protein
MKEGEAVVADVCSKCYSAAAGAAGARGGGGGGMRPTRAMDPPRRSALMAPPSSPAQFRAKLRWGAPRAHGLERLKTAGANHTARSAHYSNKD